jgi:hypothetical protein
MYKDWFLVMLQYLGARVPAVKTVLNRCNVVSMPLKELDDGRYNKVANVVGTPCSIILTEIRVLVMPWCKLVKRIAD